MKWIIICLLLLSACKTSKSPISINIRESSGNYDRGLVTVSTFKDYNQIRTSDENSRPIIYHVLLSKDTPPPNKEHPKINPQNVDSLEKGDKKASILIRNSNGEFASKSDSDNKTNLEKIIEKIYLVILTVGLLYIAWEYLTPSNQ